MAATERTGACEEDQPLVELLLPSESKGEGVEHHKQNQGDEDGGSEELPERGLHGLLSLLHLDPDHHQARDILAYGMRDATVAECPVEPDPARKQACL